MALRFRSRHLRATMTNRLTTRFTTLGWVTAPINFGADPIAILDYQPDERGDVVTSNTVAVSIGNVINDKDEEIGAGLRSGFYPVFIDVYMATQALADAVCDDVRDIFDQQIFPLVDQVDGSDSGEWIEVEEVLGPDRPAAAASIDQFKRYWRTMRVGARLYYAP